MALMALPVLIIGSFPLDPGLFVEGDLPVYIFGLDVLAIIVVLAWYFGKRLRKHPTINP
jgi:hypothetical protein